MPMDIEYSRADQIKRLEDQIAILESENQTLQDRCDRMLEYFLIYRGIENKCEKCNGSGKIPYPSTSTWRGGIGGCAVTFDVCDQCWGSGDKDKTWLNLRKVQAVKEELERKISILEGKK